MGIGKQGSLGWKRRRDKEGQESLVLRRNGDREIGVSGMVEERR